MDFNDLLQQFEQIKKMGPIEAISGKIPGLGKQLENADIDDRQIDWCEAIIHAAESDMGRIIGKQGRIAKAIRTVARSAAIRNNERISVEID